MLNRAFKSSFSLLTKMLGKASNASSTNLNFLRLLVLKILQFKVNNFPVTLLWQLLYCTTNVENYKHAATFWNFVCSLQPWQNLSGEKVFLRGNLNCHILGTERRKKLKFGEVSLQICQNFERKPSKYVFDLNALLSQNDYVTKTSHDIIQVKYWPKMFIF